MRLRARISLILTCQEYLLAKKSQILSYDSEVLERIIKDERSMGSPAYEYFQEIARRTVVEIEQWRKTKEELTWHHTVRYRTHNLFQEEREELEIVVELEKIRNQQELAELPEAVDIKQSYRLVNQILRIRTRHPVVKTIKKGEEDAQETIEKRELVDKEIADYFKQIYQRPAHMVRKPGGLANGSQSAIFLKVNED